MLRLLAIPATVAAVAIACGGVGGANRRAAPTDAPVAAPVQVTVDWARGEGRIIRAQYGLNLYAAAHPDNAGGAAYRANLEYMGAGILRLHNAGNMKDAAAWEGLIDEKRRGWDREKVKRTLAGLRRLAHRPDLVINVPSWPGWMDADADGFLDRDQFDAYAALVADLVRIANVEAKAGVRYWEVTNELDGRYYAAFYRDAGKGALKDPAKPDRWDEVAEIYNRCAAAMKRADPTIRVGGPAAARPDLTAMHERFARKALPNLDFFSFHAYASGSADTPDATVYDRAALAGTYVRQAVALLKRVSPDRVVPVMLGEYNISWTWETRDPRMANAKGAVFDALVLVHGVEAGAFSLQAWNEKDGIYGKTDGEDRRRPGAELLHLFNTRFVGERVAARTDDGAGEVVAYAVRAPNGAQRSLLLINRGDSPREAVLPGVAAGGGKVSRVSITGAGVEAAAEPAGDRRRLPPHSVTALTFTAPDSVR